MNLDQWVLSKVLVKSVGSSFVCVDMLWAIIIHVIGMNMVVMYIVDFLREELT